MIVRKLSLLAGVMVCASALLLVGCNGGGDSASGTGGAGGGAAGTRPVPTADGNAVTGDVIRVGLVASENGPLRPWGIDSLRGAQMAVDEVNEAGGINGRMVELIFEDSNSDEQTGRNAAAKLDSDGVLALVGEVASGITEQMAGISVERGLAHVAIGATKTDLTDRGANMFRVCYTDAFQGPVMATFAYNNLRLRNIAVMTDSRQTYSVGLSQSFIEHFESLGGTIVGEERYQSGETQFNAQLSQIRNLNPDGLFLSGYFTEVGAIVRQARAQGLEDVVFLGGDGWDSTELTTAGGADIVGGFFCNHYNNDEDRQAVRDFLRRWRDRHGSNPGTTMGALGYDAMKLTLDAIQRASDRAEAENLTLNSRLVIEALEDTVDFPGVSGNITLRGQNGNPPKRALVVRVTREGQEFVAAFEPEDVFGNAASN